MRQRWPISAVGMAAHDRPLLNLCRGSRLPKSAILTLPTPPQASLQQRRRALLLRRKRERPAGQSGRSPTSQSTANGLWSPLPMLLMHLPARWTASEVSTLPLADHHHPPRVATLPHHLQLQEHLRRLRRLRRLSRTLRRGLRRLALRRVGNPLWVRRWRRFMIDRGHWTPARYPGRWWARSRRVPRRWATRCGSSSPRAVPRLPDSRRATAPLHLGACCRQGWLDHLACVQAPWGHVACRLPLLPAPTGSR